MTVRTGKKLIFPGNFQNQVF